MPEVSGWNKWGFYTCLAKRQNGSEILARRLPEAARWGKIKDPEPPDDPITGSSDMLCSKVPAVQGNVRMAALGIGSGKAAADGRRSP